MKGYDVRIIAILISLACATPVFAQESGQLRQITVTGLGVVETVPDMATIRMGVVSEGKTGAVAMRKNSANLTGVLAELADAGILPRDVQTSNLTLSPRWDNRSNASGASPMIIGFTARNTVTVRIREMEKLGEILDAVVKNGANNFHGLSFGLQDPRPAQDEARVSAVKDAVAKAKLLTSAAGVELGDILSISETSFSSGGPMPVGDMAMMRSAVPVAAGEVSVNISVMIVFNIK